MGSGGEGGREGGGEGLVFNSVLSLLLVNDIFVSSVGGVTEHRAYLARFPGTLDCN